MLYRLALIATTLTLAASASLAQAADPQKHQLALKIVELWKPEQLVVAMVQQPAMAAYEQSRIALQGRVTADVQAATLKDIQGDINKFLEQVGPIALEAAKKDVTTTVIPHLESDFTLEELQQVLAIMQSPVRAKFDKLMPQMQTALGQKVAQDAGPQINPMMKSLTETVGLKLRKAAAGQ